MLSNISHSYCFLKFSLKHLDSRIQWGTRFEGKNLLSNKVDIRKGSFLKNSKIGKGVRIGKNCSVVHSDLGDYTSLSRDSHLWNVKVASYSYIAPRAEIGKTTIGKFCSIGFRLQCQVGDHPTHFISTSPVFYSTLKQCGKTFADSNFFDERRGIEIGNDVWIGSRVFIRDGIKIGNGAIIAAGAVVVENVPDYAIIAGVPAKIIRYRFTQKIITELLKTKWWNFDEELLKELQPYFVKNNIESFIRHINQIEKRTYEQE